MTSPLITEEKAFRVYSARDYLRGLELNKWHRVDHIPENIQREAVDILTTGMVSKGKRVRESADWAAFMIVRGQNELYQRKTNSQYKFITEEIS